MALIMDEAYRSNIIMLCFHHSDNIRFPIAEEVEKHYGEWVKDRSHRMYYEFDGVEVENKSSF